LVDRFLLFKSEHHPGVRAVTLLLLNELQ